MLSPVKQGLKRATRALVAAVGGTDAAAGFCRARQQKFSSATRIENPDDWLAIDTILDLEAVTVGAPGAPHVARYLAAAAGFALVPLPCADRREATWLEHIGAISREAGEVVAKLALAASDGEVTPSESAKLGLLAEAEQLLRAAVELHAAIEAIETRGARG